MTGLAFDAGEFAHDPAKSVDLNLTGSGETPQLGILRLLDATLADAKIRQFEQRIAGQLLLRNGGDVAERVRGHVAERVVPGEALFDRDPGQFGDGDFDACHLVPAQIGADDDRHEGVLAPDLA